MAEMAPSAPGAVTRSRDDPRANKVIVGGAALGLGAWLLWDLAHQKGAPPAPTPCPTGYTRNAEGTCVPPGACPWGYERLSPGAECTKIPVRGCPTGYIQSPDGTCVPGAPQPPPGYPAAWCSWDQQTKEQVQVWLWLLGRAPDPTTDGNTQKAYAADGINGVARMIINAPGLELVNDVINQAPEHAANAGSDFGLAFCRAAWDRMLHRGGDATRADIPTAIHLWDQYQQKGGYQAVLNSLNGAEFRADIQAAVAAAVCRSPVIGNSGGGGSSGFPLP